MRHPQQARDPRIPQANPIQSLFYDLLKPAQKLLLWIRKLKASGFSVRDRKLGETSSILMLATWALDGDGIRGLRRQLPLRGEPRPYSALLRCQDTDDFGVRLLLANSIPFSYRFLFLRVRCPQVQTSSRLVAVCSTLINSSFWAAVIPSIC